MLEELTKKQIRMIIGLIISKRDNHSKENNSYISYNGLSDKLYLSYNNIAEKLLNNLTGQLNDKEIAAIQNLISEKMCGKEYKEYYEIGTKLIDEVMKGNMPREWKGKAISLFIERIYREGADSLTQNI